MQPAKNEILWEVDQNKNGTKDKDDDENEDEEEQEWEEPTGNNKYNNDNEESEGTTTTAKLEGSDKLATCNNIHSSALNMYLEDSLVLELSSTNRTLFKEVVDGTLFKEFYSSPEEVNHIMGYIFHKSYKDGNNLFIDLIEQNFGLLGDYISTQTYELRQHLYRWYSIGHGKFLPCILFSHGISNIIENIILLQNA